MKQRKRILTWHVHSNYLYYLTQVPYDFYLPVSDQYGGLTPQFPWSTNVHAIPASQVQDHDFDVILFQSRKNYAYDQHDILSEAQRHLPKIYLEHDPPRQHPTDTVHPVMDGVTTVVHVTHFNQLMWDCGDQPTKVIEHGVKLLSQPPYIGDKLRGVVVINNLEERGRRLGYDVFLKVRDHVPLDVIGMGSDRIGGLGEISPEALPDFLSHYRFIFSPIRYTSLGLSLIEAMMIGLPLVGLSTTELPTVIHSGVDGFVSNSTTNLMTFMHQLLQDQSLALRFSRQVKRMAHRRFGIKRFVADWERVIEEVTMQPSKQPAQAYYSGAHSL